MTRRAIRKKQTKKFKVGDVVTWGFCWVSHVVTEVTDKGVWVDTTSADYYQDRLFLSFAPTGREFGPPVHSDLKPDQAPIWRRSRHWDWSKGT